MGIIRCGTGHPASKPAHQKPSTGSDGQKGPWSLPSIALDLFKERSGVTIREPFCSVTCAMGGLPHQRNRGSLITGRLDHGLEFVADKAQVLSNLLLLDTCLLA
ncbi:hypothetical protein [Paeniglutamicibacter cryotolerans]|uniref:Uncharacterized protein n=1 Tax=Paeniglutamicibacter cryotolerans TaxID=670079 RepID=A0A839QPD5_9MICC|nr:hypothetical protein [Paeniglutamicibacter cryotolerans]MBB2997610.1 hypothetical protein [Paeniglutamicibacter cryotolerans]